LPATSAAPQRGPIVAPLMPGSRGPGHSLVASVPWRHRLSTQALFFVFGLVFAAVTAFEVMEFVIARQRLRGNAATAEALGEAVKGSIRDAMEKDQRESAYHIVQEVARLPVIDHVRLVNKAGRITFSTLSNEVGKIVDRGAEGCRACHASEMPATMPTDASRPRVYAGNGHRVLATMIPFRNETSCSTAACHAHSAGQRVIGVLDIGISLAKVDEDLSNFRRANLAVTAIAALVLVTIFWTYAQRRVVRPVEALLEGTRRVAHDELDTEIRVPAHGEFGMLAASFNEMTRSMRRVEGDLRELTDNLEAKVEERTAELRAAQESIVRTEKLSSLGKLSASVAHEINNPLTGILTFSKVMIRTLDAPVNDGDRKTLVRQLGLVQRETERCSAIVRNLLEFSRERSLQLRQVHLHQVVDEVFTLIGSQAAIQGVELVKDTAPLQPLEADFGQIRQALANVAINALEAMPKGGSLKIITRPLPALNEAEIVIADNGIGISPELRRKIFDPFFTTKEMGTGLGLSVVYGILERHHGHIDVESEVGKGTRFTIRLPMVKG